MKRWMTIALVTAFAAVCTAPAVAADKPMTPQQQRMTDCNAKATDKKGDDRKAFMKTCLSGEEKADKNKMSMCNTQSKGMTGDDRKKFMSDCMKKAA